MEAGVRDIHYLVNMLQLTDARCKGENKHKRTTMIYVHEVEDHVDLEAYNRENK